MRATTWGRVRVRRQQDGLQRVRLSSTYTRRLGFDVAAYRLDDLLIDTGFAHLAPALAAELGSSPLAAICCTHQHEDHVGGAALLARRHGCPVFLRSVETRWSEGVALLAPYRRVFWGAPSGFAATEAPERVDTGRRSVWVIPTPGHSRSHVVLFEERSGLLFSGDLYISSGASAVLWYEDPFASACSLRVAADLGAARMLTGHCGDYSAPSGLLRAKAARIEAAAEQVMTLHGAGVAEQAIVRRVFPRNPRQDRFLSLLTSGQFSRTNFVRACVRHAQGAARDFEESAR